ncbi:hypothetical protein [Fructilactobacillus florum]|uniref:hypothetical protein n=1 Tax=Fructilactobacillus florum TaxID=640331 RepID=UPI0006D092A6|nr:hypothetical protein [Fructilactobacillus florum]
MKQKAIEQKLLKLRRLLIFLITPLCLALFAAYYFQRRASPLVMILAALVVLTYVPYGIVVLYFVIKRQQTSRHSR